MLKGRGIRGVATMKTEQEIRARRAVLQDAVRAALKRGILSVDTKMLREIEALNWVLGEDLCTF